MMSRAEKTAADRTGHGKLRLTLEWTHKRKNSHYISMIR
ncbi:hypothetical protein D1AOALGA4SA_12379 [Olavius algarvensis Delta 1 endosymbiont]|nr:hypothetical protein D1AOALGA4SA_12379 [Olavius algarvensis Delta 1 endosymbiont]